MPDARLPLIGVTAAVEAEAPDGRPRVVVKRSYPETLLRFGALPMILPASLDPDQLRAAYERLDGVLLPGGADVDPALYGCQPHAALGEVDPLLDTADLALARWAYADGKPLLGICRGQQVVNVAFGGTLYQDLPSELPGCLVHVTGAPHTYRLAHEVALQPESHVASVLGVQRLRVNSTHHQAVRAVASGWRAVATAPDGVIEAIEPASDARGFALAVQWHPEELWQAEAGPFSRLFAAFLAAARAYPGLPRPNQTTKVFHAANA